MPMTMFGLSALSPAARLLCCQRRLRASPPSMAASLEPVVEHPVAESVSGEFQRRLSMLTQRISSSAVWGYSSLSIMFLSRHSAISFSACGSHPRRHECREVQAGVAIEHELVVDDLVGHLGRHRLVGHAVLGDGGALSVGSEERADREILCVEPLAIYLGVQR